MQNRNIIDLTDDSGSFKTNLFKGLENRDVDANIDPDIFGAHIVGAYIGAHIVGGQMLRLLCL